MNLARTTVLGCLLAGLPFAGLSQVPDFSKNSGTFKFGNRFAPYVSTPERAVDRILSMARLKPGETLYDLGSGDGRIIITAARQYPVRAVGVEMVDSLVRSSNEKIRKEGLQDRVRVIHGDYMRTDLHQANVVTLYLATAANDMLRPVLERELRPSTRVVSYDYPIPGWHPVDTAESGGLGKNSHVIYLYQVPESIGPVSSAPASVPPAGAKK